MTWCGGRSLATVVIALSLNLLCYSYAQDILEEPSAAERLAWVFDKNKKANDRLRLWRAGWSQITSTGFYDLSEFKGCKKGELTYHSWPSQMKLPTRHRAPPCSFLIACYDGRPQLATCPVSGFLELREDLQGCVMTNRSTCANSAELGEWSVSLKLKCPKPNGKFSAGRVNCQNYIECINNNYFVRRCPDQLAFNDETGQCDAESEATSCAHSMWRRRDMPGGIMAKPNARPYSVPLISESAIPEGCERVRVPHLPNEIPVSAALPAFRDCRKYYHCDEKRYRYCPYLSEFNVAFGRCVETFRTHCLLQDVDYVCPEPSGDFPNPLNCNAYYHCENSRPQLRGCLKGTSFYIKEAACRPSSPDCPLAQALYDEAGGSTLSSPLEFGLTGSSETPRQSRPAALGWRSGRLGLNSLHPRI